MTTDEGRIPAPWSAEASAAYRWWCAERWTQDELDEIHEALETDPDMRRFLKDVSRSAVAIADLVRRTSPSEYSEVSVEDLTGWAFHGRAVSRGIQVCLPSDTPTDLPVPREFYFFLLVHDRAATIPVENPYGVVERAIFYQLIGRMAWRELSRRSRDHIGARAGVFQFLDRVDASAHSEVAGRVMERELDQLRKAVFGTVLRRRNRRVIGRVGRVLRRHDPSAVPGDVDLPLWQTIAKLAGHQHPLEALVRSVKGEWNVIPTKAGFDAVNCAKTEVWKHAAYTGEAEHPDRPIVNASIRGS